MLLPTKKTYAKNEAATWPIPNYWDIAALILVLALILSLGWGASKMIGHYQLGKPIPISLSPWMLPYYALRTVLRMLIALIFSLLFTFIFGTWAAKSAHAERVIIPCIDILQSVPVLGFLSVALVVFIGLFQGSMLGPECAAIFAIFTAQVWNMTLSFYQSVSTVPNHLREAASMFRLSAWQRFWRIDAAFAAPALLWNMMMSMSGSWIFLVAAEAISVGQYQINLPGIGSYIGLAIAQKNLTAIGYVIVAMVIVIALYDQIIFRPLNAWAEKFKTEHTPGEDLPESWLLNLFHRTRLFQYWGGGLSVIANQFINISWLRTAPRPPQYPASNITFRYLVLTLWYIVLAITILLALLFISHFIASEVSWGEVQHVIFLGLATALRVLILITISSLIWTPIGIWIGLNPRISRIVQPLIQFLAAFPANLFFPIMTLLIVTYRLNVNVWLSPLMILGAQWYILFNVIAGTSALPKNLHHAVGTLNVRGWLWWRRFMLPGIFPYYITGAITAAGGAWNISIIAESVNWGNVHLQATGLGAYISWATAQGDFRRLTLGIIIMALYVLVINRLLWRPLYRLAEEKFQIA
ncbi:MAG: ABC transporter permease subunit [Proteobacteria bacterium]|nr:ABC transporter permease subunit [Pseudomonadota bacterium]